jgi:hypothetical protein
MKPQLRVEGLEETLAILKTVEPDVIKEMRKEIRTIVTVSGAISAVKFSTPATAPLSGMVHSGPTKWGGVKSVTTRILSRTSAFKSGPKSVPLITISATGKDSLGFDYAELAGIRRRPPRARSKIRGTGLRGQQAGDGSIALNGQGDNFIAMLEERVGKKPGRFAYRAVFEKRNAIERGSQVVLDKYAARVNRKLK